MVCYEEGIMDQIRLSLGIKVVQLLVKLGKLNRRDALYHLARFYIGHDASPFDSAPDELGCAESVSTIINHITPFKITLGTYTLRDIFVKDTRFIPVLSQPQAGDIIISPTGMGNGQIVGHVGIMGLKGQIMSNSSATGTWEQNYNIDSWRARYRTKGALPIFYFRLII